MPMLRNVPFAIAFILIASGLLSAGEPPSPGKAAQPRASQIVWSSDKTLGFDFVVEPGEELIVNPGVRINLGADVNITVLGNMTAAGTRASPIVFDWNGQHPNLGSIFLSYADRRSHFSNCSFRNAYVGIYASYSDVDVADCTFSQCQRDGVHVAGADFTIRDCTFQNNSIYEQNSTNSAIYINAATGEVTDNSLTGNGNGIFLKDGTQATVSGNTIMDGPTYWSYGILLRSGASVTVENNSISGQNEGICSNGSTPVIKNNLIEHNILNGILLLDNDTSVVTGNVIRNNTDDGLEIHSGAVSDLSLCEIGYNGDDGISVMGTGLSMSGNDVHHNGDHGLLVWGGGNVSSSGNRIHDNKQAGITLEDKWSSLNSTQDTVLDNIEQGVHIEAGEALFEDVVIGGSKTNLVAINGSRTDFMNGSMGMSSVHDMGINDAFVSTINFTFDNSSVLIAGASPQLRICWYLGLRAIDGHLNPLAGAGVNVFNADGSLWKSGQTDASGQLRWLVLCERDISGPASEVVYTPQRIVVDVPGTGNETTVDMNQSRDITLQVYIPNSPPKLLAPIPNLTFPEDTDAYGLLNMSGYFSDEDPLTYNISYEEDASTIDGAVDRDLLDFYTPTENWNGKRRFRVAATDSEGLFAESDTFTVEVTPVDDPPVLAPAGPFVIRQNETLKERLLASDIDDPPGSLTFVSHSAFIPEVRFSLDPSTGDFSFRSERPGNYSMVVSVRDSWGLSSEPRNVDIMVLAPNHPPIFLSSPPASIHVCQTYSYQVNVFDPDGDPLRLAIASGPPGLWLNDRTVLWTTDWPSLGNASVSLRLDDRVNAFVFQNFSIRVLPVNRHPTAEIQSPSDGAIFTDSEVIFFRGRGLDPDGDAMTFTWAIDGKNAGNGTELYKTLNAGTHSISFSASDGVIVAYQNITLTVKTAPKPPISPKEPPVTIGGSEWLWLFLIVLYIVMVATVKIRERLR